MKVNNKTRILLSFACFIIYTLFLINTDIVCLILYYVGLNEYKWIGLIVGIIITSVLVFFYRNKVVFCHQKLDAIAYFFIAVIIVLGIVRGIIPDTSCDVARAHVFFQQIGFEDNITYNAFPAGYTYYFYLSDNFAYYFRLLLGYRLGTLANSFSLIVAYLEIRLLISDLVGNSLRKIREDLSIKSANSPACSLLILTANESFFSGIASLTYFAISELGTYMVDIVGLPVMIFLVRSALKKEKDEDVYQFVFYALMCGVCFAFKQTSIILIVPVLIIYLVRHRKNLNVGIFFSCLIVGIMPAAPYLIYTYVSTGNPVYITYNSIFKSPYYYDVDFKDTRWGPETLLDAVLWPIRLITNYSERVSEIITLPLPYILLGIISVFLILMFGLLNKLKKDTQREVLLSVVFISCIVLWLYTTGYMRYAIICEILAVILMAVAAADIYEANMKYKMGVSYILICILLIQCTANVVQGLDNKFDWSWRGSTLGNIKSGVLVNNAKWILLDRKIGTDEQREKVDLFLLTDEGNAYMTLFNPDVPIIGASNISQYLGGLESVKGINYVDKYKNVVLEEMANEKRVFDIEKLNSLSNSCVVANEWGVEVSNIEWMDTFFVGSDELALIEYKPAIYGNTYMEINESYTLEAVSENADKLNGYVYLNPSYSVEHTTIKLIVKDDNGLENELYFTIAADEVFDLASIRGEIQVNAGDIVELEVIDGIEQLYAINLRIEE